MRSQLPTRPAQLVYIDTHAFAGKVPWDKLIFHAPWYHVFPTYGPDPTGKFAVAAGREEHRTRCGRTYYRHMAGSTHTSRLMTAVRLDRAQHIGRPCKDCWR